MRFTFPLRSEASETVDRWSAELRKINFLTIPDENYQIGDVLVYDPRCPSSWCKPRWKTFLPTLTGSGSMTVTSPTIDFCEYIEMSSMTFLRVHITSTLGGTASNYVSLNTPTPSSGTQMSGSVTMVNGGNVIAGSLSKTLDRMDIRKYDGTNYTLTSTLFIIHAWYVPLIKYND